MFRSSRRRIVTSIAGLVLAAASTTTVATVATPAGPALAAPSLAAAPAATTHRVLFDNSKAETAGNADWIISTSMPDPLGQNANPTSETSWTGALSAWGVALQRTGQYSLKTLPAGSTITYGGTGALDLANFDEFVIPEPNILFSTAEKTAIMRFVQAGGGLFLIVDHSGSDRNNDGADSVQIVTALLNSNGVDNTDPFGFTIDTNNITTDNPPAINSSTNPVLNGTFGHVTASILRNGSTQTLHPADNSSVQGLLFRTGSSPTGTTGAFFTTSTFGSGRVAVWGDSSPIDDGTGQSGNTLFNGWNDPAGTDAALALNATAWLAGTGGTGGGGGGGCTASQLLGNPGFETGTAAPWTATSGVVTSSANEAAHGGSWKAWLDGYGTTHTDTLTQTVTIPASCATASLSYWLHIDTAETGSTVFDTLTVKAGGTTVASYSNVNAATGFTQRTVNLASFIGQTVAVSFTGAEDSTLQTSFVLDDTALNVS